MMSTAAILQRLPDLSALIVGDICWTAGARTTRRSGSIRAKPAFRA